MKFQGWAEYKKIYEDVVGSPFSNLGIDIIIVIAKALFPHQNSIAAGH